MTDVITKSTKIKRSIITINDFIAGGAGGIAQVIVGQPFDIIKVRQQTSNHPVSILKVIKDILKFEGPLAFYKGTLSPLLGISFAVSLQFAGFEGGKRMIANYKQIDEKDLSKLNIMGGGCIGGLFYSVIVSPMELFRIKMQIQNDSSAVKYKSSIDAGLKIFKNHGFQGVYKGYSGTFLREALGNSFYFGIYEILMLSSQKRHNGDRRKIPFYEIVTYGSLGGVSFWLLIFPFDLVKSKMQGSDFGDTRYSSFTKTWSNIQTTQGIGGLYRGLGAALLRAPITNACIFAAYEKTKQYLKRTNF